MKKFEIPELTLIMFDNSDVIRTSGEPGDYWRYDGNDLPYHEEEF